MSGVFDIAIVGAGPAGMAAAVEARALGLSVAVLDDQPTIGGQILRGITRSKPEFYEAWGGPLAERFLSSGVTHIANAAVWARDGNELYFSRRGATDKVKARGFILATGSMERPMMVPGHTLPGVVTAGALQSLMKGSGAVPAGRFVLAGNGPLLLLCALQLIEAGARPAAIIETTPASRLFRALPLTPGLARDLPLLRKGLGLMVGIRRSGVPFFAGASSLRIAGEECAEAIHFIHRGRARIIPASLIALHDGVVPNDNLAVSMGGKTTWNQALSCYETETEGTSGLSGAKDIWVAGDSVAIAGGYQAMLSGRLAALDAAHALGLCDGEHHACASAPLLAERKHLGTARRFIDRYYAPTLLPRQAPDETLICRCEEVSLGTVRAAIAAGADGTRSLKAATRCGMGPCQGRQCTVSVASALAAEAPGLNFERPSLRFPARPITVAELAQSHVGLDHSGSDA
ncbi:BFD domain-containing protein (2Fe-2S)-binding domain-containing protein [Nitratireductor indicus C115]|uniref:BFD domain-containing protein (2Fe-2S)-binding domain-containing protein n=1 Tax=Nitratireductor indicus C115 TaxID=1231190 RepID=K2PK68_9HYPH|nr:FAD-dependent oxidoreductase [Nitratireductor indicus]EKF41527.1 BFD domain-containing protein (2Fe-2S)-binding domain-containing protein [Nitratireductor indicus C115]SFQ69768.1 NADPH-dependent 2,4-dienoyl-CoA reductase, sulfur reductase [Nitratireductor indicus]